MRKAVLAGVSVLLLGGAGEAPPVDVAALRPAAALQRKEIDRCDIGRDLEASIDCSIATYERFAARAKIKDKTLLPTLERVLRAEYHEIGNDPYPAARAWYRFIDSVMHEEEAYMASHLSRRDGPAYDAAKIGAATAGEHRAVDRCIQTNELFTGARYECLTAAARDFAGAIKFRDMYRFESFVIRVQLETDDLMDSHAKPEMTAERFNMLHKELFKGLGYVDPHRY